MTEKNVVEVMESVLASCHAELKMASFISTFGCISHFRYISFNVYSWQEFVLFLGSSSRSSNDYLLELVTLTL